MAFNMIAIYIIVGLVSGVVTFSLLFLFISRRKNKKSFEFTSYPSIVLTSHDSPQLKEKRLWSPEKESKGTERKSSTNTERGKKSRSYWFPKRDVEPLHVPTKSEFQQPVVSKHADDEVKGRLKFSFSYDYDMETKKSVLKVRLLHGRDYTDQSDDLSMDTFVKTRLLPSKRQTFTSKLQRRALNPNYDETYHFDIEWNELSSQVLCFEVFRSNCLSRHHVFGEVIVPFKELGSSGSSTVIKEIVMSMNIIEPHTASCNRLNNNVIYDEKANSPGRENQTDTKNDW